jgi:ketosteroid isomerase-like protein
VVDTRNEPDMSEDSRDADSVAAATAEAQAVATLHDLNAHYIRAFVDSDTRWYDENLSEDFVCTLADGRRIEKAEFLRRTEEGPGVTNVTYDQIDVRPLGDVALVHGVTHYTRDGAPASTRYTDVWRSREGRWQAVAAQLTSVTAALT